MLRRRALDRERWFGGVDAVGGTTLATVLRQTRYGGCVAACGLAGGADLPTTVHPFILRGVTLAGVESVQAPLALRTRAWERLAIGLPLDPLVEMTAVEPLEPRAGARRGDPCRPHPGPDRDRRRILTVPAPS